MRLELTAGGLQPTGVDCPKCGDPIVAFGIYTTSFGRVDHLATKVYCVRCDGWD